MIIQVDEEGKKMISGLCDVALKRFGLPVREEVNKIIDSITVLKPEPVEKSDVETV